MWDLIQAGITSFKIEGRLKDINYVKNVTGFFRRKIDEILDGHNNYDKSSNGNIYLGFTPNLDKTFNRSSTNYFIEGRHNNLTNINSPKSIGEEIGKVSKVVKNKLLINFKNDDIALNNGDGISFFDSNNELQGFLINSVNKNEVLIHKIVDIEVDTILYRNQDQQFENSLKRAKTERKLPINVENEIYQNKIKVSINDIYQNEFELETTYLADIDLMKNNITKQFSKTGNTIFEIYKLEINIIDACNFIPISKINEIRRDSLEEYELFLINNYERELVERSHTFENYFTDKLDYQVNVANSYSRELYQLAGVKLIEPAFELQNNFDGKVVMTTKHCLKFENGICPIHQQRDKTIKEPLWLEGANQKYKLEFDCKSCEMKIILS